MAMLGKGAAREIGDAEPMPRLHRGRDGEAAYLDRRKRVAA
jgi:hypothetical protein